MKAMAQIKHTKVRSFVDGLGIGIPARLELGNLAKTTS